MDFYSYDDFLDTRTQAADYDDEVRVKFPDHADEARAFINKILQQHDKNKYLVFNGEAIDRDNCLGELHMAHYLVSEVFLSRDKGIEIPPFYTENTVRLWAGLSWTVIQGGQTD